MNVLVEDVVVGSGRRRVDKRKVVELASSIQEVGLLSPIVVSQDNKLIAGAHRLEAHKHLKYREIEAVVRDLTGLEAELVEIDENLIRSDLTPAERAKLTARRKEIYEEKYPETKVGGAPGKPNGGKQKAKNAKLASFASETSERSGKGKRTIERDAQRGEKVDKGVLEGIAGTSLDKGVNLDVLSKLDSERQKELVEYANDNKIDNLKVAKRRLEKDEAIAGIEDEAAELPQGPFRVIVADPPWPYKRTNEAEHRGSMTYHPMSIQEICDFPVMDIAHKNCILWLWTTNIFFRQAYQVLDAWGFEEKTVLSWIKPKMGVGNWLRNQTEHCIFAVKGKPVVKLTNQTTVLEAPLREHSRKPELFYDLVESLCPGSKVELFAREQRDGWESWGSETDKFKQQ